MDRLTGRLPPTPDDRALPPTAPLTLPKFTSHNATHTLSNTTHKSKFSVFSFTPINKPAEDGDTPSAPDHVLNCLQTKPHVVGLTKLGKPEILYT